MSTSSRKAPPAGPRKATGRSRETSKDKGTTPAGAPKPGKGHPDPIPLDDFSGWLAGLLAQEGDFTALVVLVGIGETRVTPLASTFLTFIGDEVSWSDLARLFAGSKKAWDGAAFFPVLDAGGPLENAEARARLRSLEARIAEDRLVLNDGAFFDSWGRKLKVEEIAPH